MRSTIQRLFNALGYTIHKTSTFESIVRERNSMNDRISLLESRPAWALNLPENRPSRPEFDVGELSSAALEKLITQYDFDSVVDIGAGAQLHSKVFARHGKQVTAVDLGTSAYHRQKKVEGSGSITEILGDFNEIDFPEKYDCVWASHVLEHQLNVDSFLRKVLSILKEDGVLAITVPPLKHEIVGGHVSLWNAGLLLYRLVLAGVDCREASVLAYGYNISVIVRRRNIQNLNSINLEFDCGDIRKIRQYLPAGLPYTPNDLDDPFDGNVMNINW